MKSTRLRISLALGTLGLGACTEAPSASQHRTSAAELAVQQEPLQPLASAVAQDGALVALGAKLFSDRRLSLDGTVACASCHVLDKGGQDGRRTSLGIHGGRSSVNAPTVFNSGFNFVQFWDGRATTLEEQVSGPLTNPNEMGADWPRTLAFLKNDPIYFARFRSLFADGLSEANVRSAISSFERSLTTPNARFDLWLRGDRQALTEVERLGYERFKSIGCVACHQGSNVGGNMFQRLGVMGDYFRDRGQVVEADYGRFNVTHIETDRFVFRVPSLRNVALTAPYFHDGSADTLEQAVTTMAQYQLGQTLDSATTAEVVAFLKTLTGRQPELDAESRLVAEGSKP
ncbi:MAG: cytochrome-c peroxidase [Pseudomonadota bacterium]